MTNEEMEKAIEFIIEQQAQQAARAEEDRLRLARVEESFVILVELARLADERLDTLTVNGEKIEKAMEFILEQQAQQAARAEEDRLRLARVEESLVTFIELARLADERLDTLAANDEKIEKAMEFILEQQAQQATRAEEDRLRLARVEDAFVKLNERMDGSSERIEGDESRLAKLEDAFTILVRWARLLDERVDYVERKDGRTEQKNDNDGE